MPSPSHAAAISSPLRSVAPQRVEALDERTLRGTTRTALTQTQIPPTPCLLLCPPADREGPAEYGIYTHAERTLCGTTMYSTKPKSHPHPLQIGQALQWVGAQQQGLERQAQELRTNAAAKQAEADACKRML